MKKLKLFVFGLLFMFVALVSVNAAEVGGPNASELRKCINGADQICTLTEDITSSNDLEISNGRKVTIDLNSHTITFKKFSNFSLDDGGELVLKNGRVVQESNGLSAVEIYQDAELTTENLTIEATGSKDNTFGEPKAIEISGTDKNNIAKLVISADTTINVPNGNGLTLSSFVNVTLNGTWNTARSIIPDDNQATKNTYVTFAGGTYNVADGIAIPITRGNWVFNGGTFISNNNDAVHINAPVKGKNNVAAPDALTDVVNNGVFETKSDVHKPLHAETLNGFVYGGEFRAPKVEFELPTEYIAEGYGSFVTKQNNTIVGKVSNIIVEESKNGKASVDMNSAVAGQEIAITLNADQGYELESLIVTDANGNSISVENGKFIMPSSDVTVKATFKKQAKAIVNNVSNPNTSDALPLSMGILLLSGSGLIFVLKKRYN